MNIYQKLVVTISGFVLFTTARIAPASATSFNFSYSGSNINGAVDVDGVLTTGDYNSTSKSYQITGITGTRNGIKIDSLVPSGSSSNDNLLFSSSPQVDFFGFSYIAGSVTYNLFSLPASSSSLYGENSTNGVIIPLKFSAIPASVPEYSSVPSMLILSIFIGSTLLRRKI